MLVEQTAAIQARQREARTLDGLRAKRRANAVLSTHRAAQALLRPLAVVNPYAESLTFASDRVRLRRDHVKYLALIDAIALLHQQQRPVKRVEVDGASVEYIEVLPADIALANRLAHAVLGRSLDELPPQTRRVLAALDAWVSEQAATQGISRAAVQFTRRHVRTALGLSDTQLRVHLERLVQLDYVALHGGKPGQRFAYSLLFDGDTGSDSPQAMGLTEVGESVAMPLDGKTSRGKSATSRGHSPTSRGEPPNLAGASRPGNGGGAGRLRGGKTPLKAKPDAAFSDAAPIPAPNARSRNGVAPAESTP